MSMSLLIILYYYEHQGYFKKYSPFFSHRFGLTTDLRFVRLIFYIFILYSVLYVHGCLQPLRISYRPARVAAALFCGWLPLIGIDPWTTETILQLHGRGERYEKRERGWWLLLQMHSWICSRIHCMCAPIECP